MKNESSNRLQLLLTEAHRLFPIHGKGKHSITLNGEGRPVLNLLIESKSCFYWMSLWDVDWDNLTGELERALERVLKTIPT